VAAEPPAEQQSRGLGDWLQSKLEGKAGLVMDKVRGQQQQVQQQQQVCWLIIHPTEAGALGRRASYLARDSRRRGGA
jgi:hypothetical protein